jgi:hypothetical protein
MHGRYDEIVPMENATTIYSCVNAPKEIRFFETDHRFSDNGERVKAIEIALKWYQIHTEY